MIRVEHNTLDIAEQGRPRIVRATPLPTDTAKTKAIRLSPDPFCKYNVLVSGHNPCVINCKEGTISLLKPHFTKLKDQSMELEPEALKENENSNSNIKDSTRSEGQDESNLAFVTFLDRYSNKTSKEALAILKNYILVLRFNYQKSTRDFTDFVIVTRVDVASSFQLHNVHVSPSNKYFALKFHKKTMKVYKYFDGAITSVEEFEVYYTCHRIFP